jgi:hypothetical protein
MRDTLRLRHRLALLACLPIVGTACSSAPADVGKPAAAATKRGSPGAPSEAPNVGERGEREAAAKARKGQTQEEASPEGAPPEALSPEEVRLLPIPGDPPWIDGYNPEEAPCPSGNWCGPAEAAMAITVNPSAVTQEMGCPTRITGSIEPSPISKGKLYAGLSDKRNMQGALNQHGTELARGGGTQDVCCYHWFEYCSGRAWVDEDGAHRAELRCDTGWARPHDTELGGAGSHDTDGPSCGRLRAALAAAWLGDALDEHASVASFARAVLELMAVGAPAELLAETTRAALDEIEHARLCFALARRFGAEHDGPGPLPSLAPRPADLAIVARNTFLEGCVGETIAALAAERAAASAASGPAREALQRIAQDEARHAALAWRTIAWALQRDPSRVGAALRAEALRLASTSPPEVPAPDAAEELGPWGRLSTAQHQQTRNDAWRDIIAPMLAGLLSGHDQRSDAQSAGKNAATSARTAASRSRAIQS